MRRRDRQQASAGGLLAAIAALIPFVEAVPNLYRDPEWKPGERPAKETGPRGLECNQALRALCYTANVLFEGQPYSRWSATANSARKRMAPD